MKKIQYLLFLFSFLLLLSSSTCTEQDSCNKNHKFEIPVTITPALDTFHVGDTIHLAIEFSEEMEDLNSGVIYNMKDFPFNCEINISRLDTLPAVSADFYVEYVEKIGTINFAPITGGAAVLLNFSSNEGWFIFKFDIVLNKKGVLALGFDANITNYFNYDLDKNCRNENFEILFTTNNKEENNFDMLQLSEDDRYRNYTKEYFDSFGGYVVRVIE